MLGHAQLGDPALRRPSRGSARRWRRVKYSLRRRVVLVGAQVDVVVGQHPSRALGDPQVVRRRDLEVLGRGLDHPHRPARPLDEPGVVGGRGERRVVDVERALAAPPRRKTCGVWIAHSRSGRASRTTSPSRASLTVSVTGAAAIAPSAPLRSSARSNAAEELGRDERPGGVVDDDGIARRAPPARRAPSPSGPLPPATPTHAGRGRVARRQRDDDLARSPPRGARRRRPLEQRSARPA